LSIRRVVFGAAAYLTAAGVLAGISIRLLVVPLFGPEYAESRPLVLPLVVAACCYGAGRVGVGLSLSTGRVRTPALSDGAGALVTAALCFALIPHHGAMGAALASLVGYLTAAAVSLLACADRSSPSDAPPRSQGVA
jgi:O-antigen/teichoic acid export membrane protein